MARITVQKSAAQSKNLEDSHGSKAMLHLLRQNLKLFALNQYFHVCYKVLSTFRFSQMDFFKILWP